MLCCCGILERTGHLVTRRIDGLYNSTLRTAICVTHTIAHNGNSRRNLQLFRRILPFPGLVTHPSYPPLPQPCNKRSPGEPFSSEVSLESKTVKSNVPPSFVLSLPAAAVELATAAAVVVVAATDCRGQQQQVDRSLIFHQVEVTQVPSPGSAAKQGGEGIQVSTKLLQSGLGCH